MWRKKRGGEGRKNPFRISPEGAERVGHHGPSGLGQPEGALRRGDALGDPLPLAAPGHHEGHKAQGGPEEHQGAGLGGTRNKDI